MDTNGIDDWPFDKGPEAYAAWKAWRAKRGPLGPPPPDWVEPDSEELIALDNPKILDLVGRVSIWALLGDKDAFRWIEDYQRYHYPEEPEKPVVAAPTENKAPDSACDVMECLEKYVWLRCGFDKASRRGFKAYAESIGRHFTKSTIYKAFDKFPQTHRRDFGKHHSPRKIYKPRKAQCLEGVKVEDGVALVPFGVQVSQTLRNYCSRHHLKIVRERIL